MSFVIRVARLSDRFAGRNGAQKSSHMQADIELKPDDRLLQSERGYLKIPTVDSILVSIKAILPE